MISRDEIPIQFTDNLQQAEEYSRIVREILNGFSTKEWKIISGNLERIIITGERTNPNFYEKIVTLPAPLYSSKELRLPFLISYFNNFRAVAIHELTHSLVDDNYPGHKHKDKKFSKPRELAQKRILDDPVIGPMVNSVLSDIHGHLADSTNTD